MVDKSKTLVYPLKENLIIARDRLFNGKEGIEFDYLEETERLPQKL